MLLIRSTYHEQQVLQDSAEHILARAGLARSRNEKALPHTLPQPRHHHNEDHAHEPRTHVEERSPPKEVPRLLGDLPNKVREKVLIEKQKPRQAQRHCDRRGERAGEEGGWEGGGGTDGWRRRPGEVGEGVVGCGGHVRGGGVFVRGGGGVGGVGSPASPRRPAGFHQSFGYAIANFVLRFFLCKTWDFS